jgi:MFS family permease
VFGARLLDRLGTGTRSAPRDALIASSVDEQDRGRAFGLEGIGDNTGAFIGPLLAVFLLYSLGIGIRTIFYVALVPGLLAFCMILLVKERPIPVTAKAKIDIGLRQFPAGYWKYLAVTALFCLGNSANAFLILRTQDIGTSLETTILIYAAFNLVAALISYPAGSLSDAWGRKNVLLAAFVIFLITYLGFALTRNIIVIGLLFAFYGLFQGMFRAVGKAFASDFVPEHAAGERGRLVQLHRRHGTASCEHRRRFALGSGRPHRRLLLWCEFRRPGLHRKGVRHPWASARATVVRSSAGV